jgi:hypothetical protein
MKWLLFIIPLVQSASADADFWELPPIRYSETTAVNPLSEIAADFASGKRKITGITELERLRYVLKALHVPEASQVLVFSKTSLQNSLIHPKNPRSLFFSEEAYIGYVPGGDIEAIIQDPVLGPVYYLIEAATEGRLKIERNDSNCMTCHGTSNTENVPGMLIRSVYPDEDGRPLLALGTKLVSHDTPLPERWGGYYVTGRSTLPHLGNRTYQETETVQPQAHDLTDLKNIIDTNKYPRPTSDIVSLLVLEHQCRMHNLFNTASMHYRRAFYLSRVLDTNGDPDAGSAGRVADGMAEKIVDCIFFKDEADLGENTDGNSEFQKIFESRYPRTKDGQSLADFKLYERIFKHPCSYMVYSPTFQNLPTRVKHAVITKMRNALAGNDPKITWLKPSECRKIDAILTETLPNWLEPHP